MDLITAFTIGLVGSLHCLGMCGPIAIGIPLHRDNWLKKITGGLLYNSGRIITYGLLGALFGLLGRGIQLAGLQQWTSIGIGIIMIASVIFPALFRGKIKQDRLFTAYVGRLTTSFKNLFRKKSLQSLLLIGLLNGLLPCGLVYMAIAGALNTNDMMTGIAFMAMFGVGTTPALLTLSLAGDVISSKFKAKAVKVIPVFIVVLGILFILRGMSLGITYVSPKSHKLEVKQEMNTTEPCCR
ncbi:MAG: sulfite exporter TauE/SafE family protein [Bacteroidetes bacterium]|nr:sulfite exporter TauE/SafE family protein [Bacteroidota bacterium]